MSKFNKILFYPSSLFLIVANTMPLLGALYWSWDIFTIIILYWMESAVIGFFNLLKMKKINNEKFSPLIPFFIVHYSVFMIVHLMFIAQLFTADLGQASGQIEAFQIVLKYFEGLAISLAFLFLSHAASYVFNFYQKQEYLRVSLNRQMFAPYKRIMVMHVVILLAGGGFVYSNYNEGVSAVVFLVVIKTVFDLGAHIYEHRHNIFA